MCLWGDTITGRGGVSGRAKRTARHHIQTSSSIPGLLRMVWSAGGGGDRGKGGGAGMCGEGLDRGKGGGAGMCGEGSGSLELLLGAGRHLTQAPP